ncbi:MAG: hypothetical protein ACEQR8_10420 [Cypionkella sp.]
MPRPLPPSAEIAAMLGWWREAGVDAVFRDQAETWLAQPEAATPAAAEPARRVAAPPPPPPPAPQAGGPRESWPRDLDGFRRWWLAEPSLDAGGLAPRIAPEGPAGAPLMVLVAMPEEEDRDALLSGPQGRLLAGFLGAAGLAPGQVYRAAVLPRYTPFPDWGELEREGLGTLAAHHVALARPQRLLVLGHSIPPLCGHGPAQGAQNLRTFNHEGGRVPALFEVGLDRLLTSWRSRARLWERWLEWTDGEAWREGSS